ncbi:MAG: hypothetical protein Q4B75_03120 [Eubacteriales bacterium]|nr:hypothetical protein [Eubacteriales bacterium]
MEPTKRMQLIRMLEKMERNPEISQKLGLQNKSTWKSIKVRR